MERQAVLTKILTVGDDAISSGYGRIGMEVSSRLVKRGYQISVASLYYDGLLPATNDGKPLPYWVAALGGKPNWVEVVANLISVHQPDIVHIVQDANYAEALRNAPIDWSRHAFVVTTPVDGVPVDPAWVNMLKGADGTLSISQFGVDAHRKAGIPSDLCRPGVDANTFFQLPDTERMALRAKVGIAPDAFVFGSFCQNQGRKDIPDMLRAFFAFASDKPTARCFMDMDAVSPAGWNIPNVCVQQGWDTGKLLFRADVMRMGVTHIRERYNLLDAHAVISHREGYGLPLVEAMACGVPSIALDYTSGTEICGDGKGVLIPPLSYRAIGTWGGAEDCFPDVPALTRALQSLHDNVDERRAIAKRGMLWARSCTWDAAADAVATVYERVTAKRQAQMQPAQPVITPPAPVMATVDGVQQETVALVEAT